ncbi:NAD-binding protein, partial [Mesorhizobium sp. M0220]|uniref:NAD-binding protein n=1 Tax=Mesorhizobium sp. M0220 TaxID=2956920 RepID=UPI003335CDF9
VGASLKQAALPFLVIEDADKTLAKLKAEGVETVAGNAANGDVFAASNAEGAKRLILAIPNAFEAGQVVLRARAANQTIEIIARAHSDAEVEHLKGLGADTVIMGEREIARGIVEEVLAAPKPSAA